ncbi:MAG TPA: hypothetical protein VFJ43_12520 [Bacteroidia bacterium]|nr:hypothetical protein [Bacteroidia bacterium]
MEINSENIFRFATKKAETKTILPPEISGRALQPQPTQRLGLGCEARIDLGLGLTAKQISLRILHA